MPRPRRALDLNGLGAVAVSEWWKQSTVGLIFWEESNAIKADSKRPECKRVCVDVIYLRAEGYPACSRTRMIKLHLNSPASTRQPTHVGNPRRQPPPTAVNPAHLLAFPKTKMEELPPGPLLPGLVVLARHMGSPWWPAISGRAPATGTIDDGHGRTWVFFFGDNTGAWMKHRYLRLFTTANVELARGVNHANARYAPQLPAIEEAIKLAEEYMTTPVIPRPMAGYNPTLTEGAVAAPGAVVPVGLPLAANAAGTGLAGGPSAPAVATGGAAGGSSGGGLAHRAKGGGSSEDRPKKGNGRKRKGANSAASAYNQQDANPTGANANRRNGAHAPQTVPGSHASSKRARRSASPVVPPAAGAAGVSSAGAPVAAALVAAQAPAAPASPSASVQNISALLNQVASLEGHLASLQARNLPEAGEDVTAAALKASVRAVVSVAGAFARRRGSREEVEEKIREIWHAPQATQGTGGASGETPAATHARESLRNIARALVRHSELPDE